MTEFTEALREEMAVGGPEVRYDYAELLLDSMIALQIKTLRQQQKLTQEQLAERAEMKQSRISTMEQVDYSSWSVQTLKRLARAFDLRLRVTFESFGTLLDDYTKLGRADLERAPFADDPIFKHEASVPRAEIVVSIEHQEGRQQDEISGSKSIGKILDFQHIALGRATVVDTDNRGAAHG